MPLWKNRHMPSILYQDSESNEWLPALFASQVHVISRKSTKTGRYTFSGGQRKLKSSEAAPQRRGSVHKWQPLAEKLFGWQTMSEGDPWLELYVLSILPSYRRKAFKWTPQDRNFWTSLGSSSISHNGLYISYHKIRFKIWDWMTFTLPFFSFHTRHWQHDTICGRRNTTIWQDERWWGTGRHLQWLSARG